MYYDLLNEEIEERAFQIWEALYHERKVQNFKENENSLIEIKEYNKKTIRIGFSNNIKNMISDVFISEINKQ